MSAHGAKPTQERFELGPDGFVVEARFVLAEADWKTALTYCNRVAAVSTGDISFSDVALYVANLQTSARSWVNNTYPSEIVSLADAVVHYASQTGVYFPALAQVLDALGREPKKSELLQQVHAILQVLTKAPEEQSKAAAQSADAAGRFAGGAAASEKKLRVLFDTYASIYLPGAPRQRPVLPEGLDAPVSALGRGWTHLSDELAGLKSFVDARAAEGEPFSVDIAAAGAIALWKTAGEAANNWRREAFGA
jgi:hypothetical protein